MPKPSLVVGGRWFLTALCSCALSAPFAHAAPAAKPDFTVRVDARETARGLLHVTQVFPAQAGTLALSYPRWIPGEHGPTGPSTDVIDFVATAGGKTLAWKRDPADMTTMRITVPSGAKEVSVAFDFAVDNSTAGFTSAACSTPNLLMLSWNEVTFYPSARKSDALTVAASVVLPEDWEHATSLTPASAGGEGLSFEPCTFTQLVDSPVLAGRYFRTVDLAPGAEHPVRLRMACDSQEGLAIPDREVESLRNLVREAHALFGGEHYQHYDFLVSLSST